MTGGCLAHFLPLQSLQSNSHSAPAPQQHGLSATLLQKRSIRKALAGVGPLLRASPTLKIRAACSFRPPKLPKQLPPRPLWWRRLHLQRLELLRELYTDSTLIDSRTRIPSGASAQQINIAALRPTHDRGFNYLPHTCAFVSGNVFLRCYKLIYFLRKSGNGYSPPPLLCVTTLASFQPAFAKVQAR